MEKDESIGGEIAILAREILSVEIGAAAESGGREGDDCRLPVGVACQEMSGHINYEGASGDQV